MEGKHQQSVCSRNFLSGTGGGGALLEKLDVSLRVFGIWIRGAGHSSGGFEGEAGVVQVCIRGKGAESYG